MTFTNYATAPMRLERTAFHEWSIAAFVPAATIAVPSPQARATRTVAPDPALRRERAASASGGAALRFAGWELDLIDRRLIAPSGGTERLPGLEFALLKAFAARAGQPLSRRDLAGLLTRDRDTRLSGRSVDSYVSRLRRRLDRGGATLLITTVWGIGYRFDADVQWR